MSQVFVRYGPSPTGIPHIGNIRTALFNYLFAKSQNGKFLLRIEDTDQARIVPGAVEKIKASLTTLGLKWDGEIVFQSKRLDIYKKHLEILKKTDQAFEENGAWRFKINRGEKSIKWEDAVHGFVQFPTNVLEDFIIIKSDGFPTYHFASVIDDHLTNISHVFRGDEWISSTPKHLQLYDAFGWQPPKFVHLPSIVGQDRKKLSKREGAKPIMEYIEDGFLPEALLNFMVLLGWAPKSNQEFFSLADLTKEFSLDRINKNSPVFNMEKLNWFNAQWLKRLSTKEFNKRVQAKFPKTYASRTTKAIAPLVTGRITTLNDFPNLAGAFYHKPKVNLSMLQAVPLSNVTVSSYSQALQKLDNWTPDSIRSATASFAEKNGIETKDLYRSLGVATFGNLVTPPLPESITIIGQQETIQRLNELAKKKK